MRIFEFPNVDEKDDLIVIHAHKDYCKELLFLINKIYFKVCMAREALNPEDTQSKEKSKQKLRLLKEEVMDAIDYLTQVINRKNVMKQIKMNKIALYVSILAVTFSIISFLLNLLTT